MNTLHAEPCQIDPADVQRLDYLRARLVEEARGARRDDLLRHLDDLPAVDDPRPIRAVVVGETKRGKSTLFNTLVGRPLLSPVGVDVTTSCWLEVGYGERDEAEIILADPASLGSPIRRRCELREVAQYVALDEVTDPVIGVQVRVRSPVLRDLVLVDTPGVGGLLAGHSRTTLAALRTADALLFVCDSRAPILAPEVEFLAEAARRVPTVVVAVTKCDVNPDFEPVLEETRLRIAGTPGLAGAPVLAVAAPLADRASDTDDERRSGRLRELSGIMPLLATLQRKSAAGSAAVRFDNAARVLVEVCRTLTARSDEIIGILAGDLAGNEERERALWRDIAGLREILDDTPRLQLLVRQHLSQLRHEPAAAFDADIDALRTRYRAEAERGAAAHLSTLASRLVGDMTAVALDALEAATQRCTQIVADLIDQLGGAGHWPTAPTTAPARFAIGLAPPDTSTACSDADRAATSDLFRTLVELLAGSAAVVTLITGPGVIAASLAIAAGAGWWKARGGGEQERRARLRDWVETAVAEAGATFRREIDSRVLDAECHAEAAVPAIISGRERELTRLADELNAIRSAGRDLHTTLAERRASAEALRDIGREASAMVALPRGAIVPTMKEFQ